MKTKITLPIFELVATFEKLRMTKTTGNFNCTNKILLLLVFMGLTVKAQVNWVPQTLVFPTGYTSGTNISLIDQNNLWVYSDNTTLKKMGFSKTTNGITFNSSGELIYGSGFSSPNCFQALSANTAVVLFFKSSDNTGVLKKTTDGGSSWTDAASFNSFPNFVHFFDANNGIVVCDPPNETSNFLIYKTVNGGANWTLIPAGELPALEGYEYGLNTAYDYVENSLWFATSNGRFFKTNNQGTSWSVSQSPYAMMGPFATGLGAYFSLDNSATAYILNWTTTEAYKTTTGGADWTTLVAPNTGQSSFIKKVPGANVLVASGSTSKYSIDGGYSWTTIDSSVKRYLKSAGLNSTWSIGGSNGLLYKLDPTALKVVNDKNQTQKINIYPNPIKDYLSIANTKESSLNYQIFEGSGKKVLTGTTKSDEKINISKLNKGVYFIEINGKSEKSTLKFIKE